VELPGDVRDIFDRLKVELEAGTRVAPPVVCSWCDRPPRTGQRTCISCHAAFMRAWRRQHPLTGEQRRRANARSYAHVYLKRGKLTKAPCEQCGDPDSQMHHPDYNQPLNIVWYCRPCHLAHHRKNRD